MTTLPQPYGDANHHARQTLNMALIYALAGVRVIPLKPKQKTPLITGWQTKATTDPKQLHAWFDNSNENNIGLVMGEWEHTETLGTYLVCIDVDMHDDDGKALLAALVAEHGSYGEPFIADTAANGLHLVYQSHVKLDNGKGDMLPGIDVRGNGGFIMVEPSTHPINGRKPIWRAGASWPTARPGVIPSWWLSIIQPTRPTPPAPEPRQLRAVDDTARPGDIYNANNTWDTELTKHGWQLIETRTDDAGQKSYWARPGKAAIKNTHAAVLNYDAGKHGVLTVFSTNAPRELANSNHQGKNGVYTFNSPFDFHTVMHHAGNHKQAAREYGAELRPQQQHETDQLMGTTKTQLSVVNSEVDTKTKLPDQPTPGHTWVLRTMSELIGVPYEPKMPDRLMLNNGDGIFYSDDDNLTAAAAGAMKSYLAGFTCLQQMQQGKHVVIIDYEMKMHTWFQRLHALGATNTEMDFMHYCRPWEPLQYRNKYGETLMQPSLQVMRDEMARINDLPGGLAWVVIDGVTDGMSQNDMKLLDNQDISKFWQMLPKLIVETTGAGVGLNDHVPKNAKGEYILPLGGQHKVATTSGAAHVLLPQKFLSKKPLTPGVVLVRCIKDRHGEVGQNREVAEIIFTPQPDGKIHTVARPYTGEHQQRLATKHKEIIAAIELCNNTSIKAGFNKVAQQSTVDRKKLQAELTKLENLGLINNLGTKDAHDWWVVKNQIVLETE